MKKFLLVLFLAGCAAEASNKAPDAAVSMPKSSDYVENRMEYVHGKYYPSCVKHCFSYTHSFECVEKCSKDFAEIKKVLIRAIRDGKEDDFDDMMESWYGQE